MQPEREKQTWNVPNEQASQAPFVASSDEYPRPATSPVVTISPEAPEDAYLSDQPSPADPEPQYVVDPDNPVRWRATEYIQREKNPLWFIVFAVVTILLIMLALLVIRSNTFAVLVPVMAAALLVYARRPPRELDYTLSRKGLHVNDHLYSYAEFKAFAIVKGDDQYSILLIPTKRFKPGVSVYFPEDAGEAIVDILGARLPMQELHLDLVDQIIRKLRI